MFYSDDGRVNVVEPGGPAARAGIEPGDRIVFAEMPAASRLLAIEQMNPAGDVLQFTIERRGQSHTVSLQLIAPISFDFVSLIKRPIAALLCLLSGALLFLRPQRATWAFFLYAWVWRLTYSTAP